MDGIKHRQYSPIREEGERTTIICRARSPRYEIPSVLIDLLD